jgi:hypothetical protein
MDRRADAATPVTTPVTTVVPTDYRTPLVSRWALDQIEIYIMDLVADLLDHGWEPEALVDEVDELALRGPHAGQIVTLALVSHAGYWMSDTAMFDLLDEVDELAAGFHHLVGLTIPGWLNRYSHDDVEFGAALDGVADIFEILPELPCPSATSTRSDDAGSVRDAWRRHRP